MQKLDTLFQQAEKAFKWEDQRRDVLDKKAEKIVAAIALILGLRFLQLENLDVSLQGLLGGLSLLSLIISLLLSVISTRVLPYLAYPRGDQLRDEIKPKEVTDDDAMILVTNMYLTAHDANAALNDNRATTLTWSMYLLCGGIACAAFSKLSTSFI